ncbi:Uncharacterised protein [Vibrio cholerae]|uniref:Uncharacterized protein n=2 Tax=Vibrio cholerae TaxID=666 RepID=A0A655Y5R9_VIBCL|nr:Uncharacterised protein [Vibrio cholerae]CSC29292.1 Uncharacterised protein [Vibrio cholerae]
MSGTKFTSASTVRVLRSARPLIVISPATASILMLLVTKIPWESSPLPEIESNAIPLSNTSLKSSCILRMIESRLNRPSNLAAPLTSEITPFPSLVSTLPCKVLTCIDHGAPSHCVLAVISNGARWIPELIPKRAIKSLLLSPFISKFIWVRL